MVRAFLTVALISATGIAAEPTPLRFQFKAGEVYSFAVAQTITVAETTKDERTGRPESATTNTKLALTRRWEVKSVAGDGSAVLEMSIAAIRQEIARPGPADKDGKPTVDTLVLDSATQEGQKQTAEFLGKPVVTVTLDPQGRVKEAKAAGGTADRLSAELPFRVALPDQYPTAAWTRPFTITLAPPLGTGEKFAATQTYALKGETGGFLALSMSTALNAEPKDAGEWPALVPLLWAGDVYFQPQTGRYAGCRLSVKKEVANHRGDGTKFVYQSDYTEALAEK